MSDQRTELEKLGEFGLIEHLTKDFVNQNPSTSCGIGDDAAVISISDEDAKLISTDMLIEGVHFNLMYMPL
ncbi:MAG: thiamine-phosphate kinase, partial [Crocinitomicaceae bacterium]|nr:thiamine-phosphate kinase [Crocinitomicaceae bacterium]